MSADMIGSTVRVEFADPWSKIDQYAKRKEARNRVDKSCCTEIVKTEHGDQPAICVPAPGRCNNPCKRAKNDRQNSEPDSLNAFNHGTRHNRGCCTGEKSKGAKEDTGSLICDIWSHILSTFTPTECDG